MKKRVLLIAYAFPPCGGAGVQRTVKFARYLPDFDWLPTILTVVSSCYGLTDDSHNDELSKEVEVIRTWHFDPVTRFTKSSGTPTQSNGNNEQHSQNNLVKQSVRSFAGKSWITFDNTFLIPDQAVLWCPRAIAEGLAAHARHKFDLIYATGEPYSDYFTASILSRMTGVPYVLDMRDPWTLSPYRSEKRSAVRKSIERWQERQMLAGCRMCLFANRASDLYAEIYPEWADKLRYLPNGYDAADFNGVAPKPFDKFTIVHSGTFLPGYRTADTFLSALRGLLNSQPALSERMQVLFVGKIGEEQKLIREFSLDGIVHQTGYVPHHESIAYLKGADLLLLVGGNHAWEETGKVYEYLASGKPILALVEPKGSAAKVLRETTGTCIIDRDDIAATEKALADSVSGKQYPEPQRNSAWVEQYDRKQLTGKLARIFDESLLHPQRKI